MYSTCVRNTPHMLSVCGDPTSITSNCKQNLINSIKQRKRVRRMEGLAAEGESLFAQCSKLAKTVVVIIDVHCCDVFVFRNHVMCGSFAGKRCFWT
jgi:hypothetical protein